MEHSLELRNLHLSFSQSKQTTPVLGGVSLYVQKGEFVSIIGPSGSGKSTLFHLIGGLLKPDSGQIIMNESDITGKQGMISYMPQNDTLLPWRTIEQNVALAAEVSGVPRKEALAAARDWLEKVGLQGYESAYPHVLSGGMRQRAAFLRALLAPQEWMCLDEPFAALDALTRSDMQRWLLQLWEQNRKSVLFITHSVEEAIFLSDRIYVLSAKPASIVQEFHIPFARPRLDSIIQHPDFIRIRAEIEQLLRHASPAY